MSIFTKPALTATEQFNKLRQQGMLFPDRQMALAYLQYVGALRMKAYWFDRQDPTTKKFLPDTTFQMIIDRYEFDRCLRAHAFYAIDRLEIAIRTTIANQLALRHGPHWYLNAKIFRPNAKWQYGAMIKAIEDAAGRASGRAFIASYNARYDDPYIAQSWAIAECVTFGFWSKTYEILRDANDKKAISKKFHIDKCEVFISWIHTLNYFRNLVAHHEKLLNINLAIAASSYKAGNIRLSQGRSIFAVATIINFLSQATQLPNSWKPDLVQLFADYPQIDIGQLGFPRDWTSKPGW